jgi:hypothetical protein
MIFEDDDLYIRVNEKSYSVSRYQHEIGRYTMLSHVKDKPNERRWELLKKNRLRIDKDGLSSLKYNVIKFKKEKLYTKILVYYDEDLLLKEASFLK